MSNLFSLQQSMPTQTDLAQGEALARMLESALANFGSHLHVALKTSAAAVAPPPPQGTPAPSESLQAEVADLLVVRLPADGIYSSWRASYKAPTPEAGPYAKAAFPAVSEESK